MKYLSTFLILLFLAYTSKTTFAQSVGINTPTLDPTAALDIVSNDKGVLVPRVTAAQRVAIGITNPNTTFQVHASTGDYYGHFTVNNSGFSATETNNAGFEIHRSTDGTHFEYIDWTEGNGTTTAPTAYHFTDLTAIPGAEYYYRLIQKDYNGTIQPACDIVRIALDNNFYEGLNIAPNPASSQTTVYLPATFIGSILHLTNAEGKLIRKEPVTSEKHDLFRNDLPSGIYFLKLEDNATGKVEEPIKLTFID